MKPKKAGFITRIIIAAVMAYALINLASLKTQLADMSARKAEMEIEAEILIQSNAEYQYGIDHSDDPEAIEQVAREKLGLVLPGEKVFYDIRK